MTKEDNKLSIVPTAILDFIAPVDEEDRKDELDKVEQIIQELQTNGEYPKERKND